MLYGICFYYPLADKKDPKAILTHALSLDPVVEMTCAILY